MMPKAEPAAEPVTMEVPAYAIYLDPRMAGGLLAGLGDPGAPGDEGRAHDALHRLLAGLRAAGLLRRVETAADLEGVAAGDVVEVAGAAHGNPLLGVLDFVATMIPIVEEPPERPERPRRGDSHAAGPGRVARPAALPGVTDAETGPSPEMMQRILAGVVRVARDGLRANPVVDVLVVTSAGLAVVAVLDRSLLGPAGEALLADGRYRVIGKVVSVLGPGDAINLFRRSVLAAAGPEASRDMLTELAEGGMDLELADPVVEGPALQVVPLAVLL